MTIVPNGEPWSKLREWLLENLEQSAKNYPLEPVDQAQLEELREKRNESSE